MTSYHPFSLIKRVGSYCFFSPSRDILKRIFETVRNISKKAWGNILVILMMSTLLFFIQMTTPGKETMVSMKGCHRGTMRVGLVATMMLDMSIMIRRS